MDSAGRPAEDPVELQHKQDAVRERQEAQRLQRPTQHTAEDPGDPGDTGDL